MYICIYTYILCPYWEESNAQQNFGGPTHGPRIFSWRSPRHWWYLGDLWHLHRFDGYDPVLMQNSPQRSPTEAHDTHLIVPVCPCNDCNNLIQFLHVFAPSRPHLLYVLAALQWCSSECEELLSNSESTVLCTFSERSHNWLCLSRSSWIWQLLQAQDIKTGADSPARILQPPQLQQNLEEGTSRSFALYSTRMQIWHPLNLWLWICQIWLWRGHS